MDAKHSTPRAVELIRVSTAGQAERDTPEIQRRALDRLRSSRPCIVVERIEALGVSGALGEVDRADLRKLSALAKDKAFDELRVWSVDRLTRSADLRERAAIWGYALDAGAVIVDGSGRVLDPADESGVGEIDYYLQTFFAARERAKIIARTGAGRRKAADDGRLSQGQPPYGRRFDRESKTWVLVQDQVEVYRRIVAETLAGRSTREVAADLNASGSAPTRGSRWGHSTVKRLLNTEAIVGRYRTCGTLTEIPPIVDAVTWARARASLRSHASSGPKPRREAMLRGLLACGACGVRVHVLSDGAGSAARYGCPKPSQRPLGSPSACLDRRTVQVAAADEAVRSVLLAALSDPSVLLAAVKATSPAARPPVDSADEMRREVTRLRSQEERLLRLLDDGLLSEDVARQRLSVVREARRASARRSDSAAVAAQDVAACVSDSDLALRASALGRAVRRASAARWHELLRILVPARAPFGIWLRASGIEVSARLPMDPVNLTGVLDTTSTRSGQNAGVPILLSVAV